MSFFEFLTKAESAVVMSESARAVLSEVNNYFDSTKKEDLDLLPYYASHISMLLTAATDVLFRMEKELDAACALASQTRKEERTNCQR